jgi:hypothetical protein
MIGNWKRILIVIGIGIAAMIVFAGWRALQGSRPQFQGEAMLIDAGFASYPRYFVQFPTIQSPFESPYEWRFRGVPCQVMTFSLHAPLQTNEQVLQDMASTRITLSLTDSCGNTVCQVDKPASEWIVEHVPGSASHTRLWLPECREMGLRPDLEYTLRLRISGFCEDQSRKLTPELSGGGIELP